MGYTHYWRFQGSFLNEKDYKAFLSDCRKLIKASPVPLANGMGDAGTKPQVGATVSFNGVGENAHETAIFPKDPVDLDPKTLERYRGCDPRFNFCKTARKPYDVIVVACLCVMQERLGKSIEVSSDGNAENWEDGRAFAEKVLGRPIKVPAQVEPQAERERRYTESRRAAEANK